MLTQKIADYTLQSPVDYSLDPIRTENPAANDGSNSQYEGESARQDLEREQSAPDYGEDATTDQQTDRNESDSNAEASGESSQGGSAADARGNAQEGDRSGRNGLANAEGGNLSLLQRLPAPGGDADAQAGGGSQGGRASDSSTNQTWNPGQSDEGGGTGQDKGKTYDDGTFEELPQDVGKIAACGPYATVVQSLGGKGALAAVDANWLNSVRASGAYPGELDSVRTAWNEDGRSGSVDLQAIVDSGADVVLVSSTYNNLNKEQEDYLTDRGVSVLTMPAIGARNSTDADVMQAVQVVGEILKDAGASGKIGEPAGALSSRWLHVYHDDVLDKAYTANGGYTIYVAEIVDGALNYLYQGNREYQFEHGRISDTSSGRRYCAYADEWLEGTGLSGMGMAVNQGIISGESEFDLRAYYFQHAGLADTSANIYGSSGKIAASVFPPGMPSVYGYVPQADEPNALVTRTEELARTIVNASRSSEYHKFGKDPNPPSVGLGEWTWYNVGAQYPVWVMPTGADGASWDDGTFESFLIAPYFYGMARGAGTAYADETVQNFYRDYYRCSRDAMTSYGVGMTAG